MPRELKKRGRREEKKRKAVEEQWETSPKRQRLGEDSIDQDPTSEVIGNAGDDFIQFEGQPAYPEQAETGNIFYGVLDEEEQAYYSNVNAKLNANDFESDDDRDLFVQAVHRETTGKELKIASSQSCSRYLEKIVMLSKPEQLRILFTAFLEDLTYLVQHRFGSHCCEALFIQSAKFLKSNRTAKDEESNLEDLFLQAVSSLSPNLGFLVTDRFASHCVRVLLLILAGEQADEASKKMLASRRKENIELPDSWERTQVTNTQIPKSFHKARGDLITAAFAGLDTTYVRALATHPIGNPFLQLVLKVELTLHGNNKENAKQLLYPNLFPDQAFENESDTGKFIQGLIYDPAGSHLVETLVLHLPGRLFKKLYANILKEKMSNLAKNDVASYVAIRVIERLGKDDLAEVHKMIQPEIPTLITRSRFTLLKTLFERSLVRNVDSQALVTALTSYYDDDDDTVTLLPKLLQIDSVNQDTESRTEGKQGSQGRASLHGSLLVQTMARDPKAALAIQESLLSQPESAMVSMAKDNSSSRALQEILTSDQASPNFRKKAIPKFFGHIVELAETAAGSYVVDALWKATNGIHFLKEKIARELASKESILRESIYGRTVWRNWSMDTYLRRPGEWHALAKGHANSYGDSSAQNSETRNTSGTKTAIQLARERFAKIKGRKEHEQSTLTPVVAGK